MDSTDFPEAYRWRVSALQMSDLVVGYLLVIPDVDEADPSQLVRGVWLEFAFVDDSGQLESQDDFFEIDPENFLRNVASGTLSFNGNEYALQWLDSQASADIVSRYGMSDTYASRRRQF